METKHGIREERAGRISASELDACNGCDARFLRCLSLEESKPSTLAKRGQKLHKALEESKFDGLCPSDIRTVDILMDKESSLVDKFGITDYEIFRERRFWMGDTVSAKVDVMYYSKEVSLIIDYKTGWLKNPEENHILQIDCQALCASCELESVAYVSALISPIGHYYKVYGHDELLEAEINVLDVCDRSYNGSTATPNEASCKYCLAKEICKEYNESKISSSKETIRPLPKRRRQTKEKTTTNIGGSVSANTSI